MDKTFPSKFRFEDEDFFYCTVNETKIGTIMDQDSSKFFTGDTFQ